MRIAALYDIHGNLPALEAVLDDVQRLGADAIVVGGDLLPGPMARETLECLLALSLPVSFIVGNGDRESMAIVDGVDTGLPAEHRAVVRWSGEQLSSAQREFVKQWRLKLSLDIPGAGEVLFCHATPRNDTEIFTRLTSEERLLPVFDGVSAEIVVCGHTHMQFDRVVGSIRVVNAGSVGMPFGEPGAFCLMLGPQIQFHRTAYDLPAAAARIRATAYPQAEQFAANNVLNPPTEEQILAVFANAELK